MRAVKSKDTGPEMIVRRVTHALGYRYRLHRADLPGKPDLVFPGRRKVIFVHGCWWHGHDCPRGAREPATRRDYWLPKIARTKTRDAAVQVALSAKGWDCLVIWECELRDREDLARRISTFLAHAAAPPSYKPEYYVFRSKREPLLVFRLTSGKMTSCERGRPSRTVYGSRVRGVVEIK